MNSVAPTVVCDTNSLWNFAVVNRLDIVATRIGHRVAWVDTVADEVQTATGYVPALASIPASGLLGTPVECPAVECIRDIMLIQKALSGPGESPTKNLGEAHCIHFIETELLGDGVLFTDDLGATDLAIHRGIQVLSTPALLREAFEMGELVCPEPYTLLVDMADSHNRGVQVPPGHAHIC